MSSPSASRDLFEAAIGQSVDRFVARRRGHVETFLETRGLSLEAVQAACGPLLGETSRTLVVSSPVHGLANATSDLDLVVLVEDPSAEARVPFNIHDGAGNVLELHTVLAEAVEGSCAELEELARRPAPSLAAGLDRWPLATRKYMLERLINGLSLDGTMPFLGHYPALARTWTAQALMTALRYWTFARLAAAAGEGRGSAAYLLGGSLHAKDALLCHRGEIFSGRKWIQARWHRFEVRSEDAELAAALDRAFDRAARSLRRPDQLGDARRLSEPLAARLEELCALPLGAGLELVRPRPLAAARVLADTWVVAQDGGPSAPSALVQVSPDQLPERLTADRVADLDGPQAASLLALVRSGLYTTRFEPSRSPAPTTISKSTTTPTTRQTTGETP